VGSEGGKHVYYGRGTVQTVEPRNRVSTSNDPAPLRSRLADGANNYFKREPPHCKATQQSENSETLEAALLPGKQVRVSHSKRWNPEDCRVGGYQTKSARRA
jgi:hypothetical protein